jgi:sortase (surface protein transpeptidase)
LITFFQGHYKGSYYPDENGQIVLSGHRDTVFRRTGELKKGFQIIRIGSLYNRKLCVDLWNLQNANCLSKLRLKYYKGSYYPDENGQIVLSGHRDTVFRRTGELKKGDQLKVKLPYGSFQYKIENMKIVDKNDTSAEDGIPMP